MKFSDEQITKLSEGFQNIIFSYNKRLLEYPHVKLENPEARKYLLQGFLRRLKTLKRCIENVYTIDSPENDRLLSDDDRDDLGINIQAFVLNLYGCIDNLAWIFVKEKEIQIDNPAEVGFMNEKVKLLLPDNFKSYISNKRLVRWYKDYCIDFRHALAHRIPLYVPSGVSDIDKYNKIQLKRNEALLNNEFEKLELLDQEEQALMHNFPVFTHSESPNQVIYHSQLLADFNTIIELADKFFKQFQN